MKRRAITRNAAIRLKTPSARIPGSHGERTSRFGIGSMYPLDQNARQNKVIADPCSDPLNGFSLLATIAASY